MVTRVKTVKITKITNINLSIMIASCRHSFFTMSRTSLSYNFSSIFSKFSFRRSISRFNCLSFSSILWEFLQTVRQLLFCFNGFKEFLEGSWWLFWLCSCISSVGFAACLKEIFPFIEWLFLVIEQFVFEYRPLHISLTVMLTVLCTGIIGKLLSLILTFKEIFLSKHSFSNHIKPVCLQEGALQFY